MADLFDLALLSVLGIIAILFVLVVVFLLIRFLFNRAKDVDYVQKQYLDTINFMVNNCPDSLYGQDLWWAATIEGEGTNLGKIEGYMVLAIDELIAGLDSGNIEKDKEFFENELQLIAEKIEAGETKDYRHCVAYLPKKMEFNFLNPATWLKKLRIGIIDPVELPLGRVGTLKWVARGLSFYKYFDFSLSDSSKINKVVLGKAIERQTAMDMGLLAWESAGKLVEKAIDTDSSLGKDIKRMSEFNVRAKK